MRHRLGSQNLKKGAGTPEKDRRAEGGKSGCKESNFEKKTGEKKITNNPADRRQRKGES